MSETTGLNAASRVAVRRYRDDVSTLLGRDLVVMPLDDAVDALLKSGFMRDWLAEKITQHLEKGGEFVHAAPDGRPKSVYRLANGAELVTLAAQGRLDKATGSGTRRSGRTYRFHLDAADWSRLKGQGRVLLELVAESGAAEYSVAGLEQLLEAGRDRLKTKPDRNLLELFRFHLSETYKKLGLVVVENNEAEKDEDEDEDEDEGVET